MLEQIGATTEDARKTRVIVAMGLMAFGAWALAGAAAAGGSALAALGVAAAAAGLGMLQWTARRATMQPKHLAA
jgi:hypothetical protein